MQLNEIVGLAEGRYDSSDPLVSIHIIIKPIAQASYYLEVCKFVMDTMRPIFETKSMTLEGKEQIHVQDVTQWLASRSSEEYVRRNIEHLHVSLDGVTLVHLDNEVRRVPKLLRIVMFFNAPEYISFNLYAYQDKWLIDEEKADSRYGESWDYAKMGSNPDIEGILFRENAIPLCKAIGHIYARFGSEIEPGGTTDPDTDNIFINLAKRLAKK